MNVRISALTTLAPVGLLLASVARNAATAASVAPAARNSGSGGGTP